MLSKMSGATGNELVINGSFHQAFSSILVLAQCLGVMPIIGIKGNSSFNLRFTWKSFRTIYSVIALLFATSYTIFATCITLTKPVTFNSVGLYRDKYSFRISLPKNVFSYYKKIYL